jgi:hypothetical protein
MGGTSEGGLDACADGKKGGDESDVDCGGGCEPCNAGSSCGSDTDCASTHCADSLCCDSVCDGRCRACSKEKTGGPDGTCTLVPADTDPDEECDGGDVCDGAGLCRCANGVQDGTEPFADCNGPCVKPCDALCMDGKQDNLETDVDCGGQACPKCLAGAACAVDSDCTSGRCSRSMCG